MFFYTLKHFAVKIIKLFKQISEEKSLRYHETKLGKQWTDLMTSKTRQYAFKWNDLFKIFHRSQISVSIYQRLLSFRVTLYTDFDSNQRLLCLLEIKIKSLYDPSVNKSSRLKSDKQT